MSTAPSKDRASLCTFTFADGRRCRTPRCTAHPHFCYFHVRKEAQALAAQKVGHDLASCLSADFLSACDLSHALAYLISAVAQGNVKPKTASTLAYLSQTLLQSVHFAEHEFRDAFGWTCWRDAIRCSFAVSTPDPQPQPEPAPAPNTEANPQTEPLLSSSGDLQTAVPQAPEHQDLTPVE
jgi:hypothetical protein